MHTVNSAPSFAMDYTPSLEAVRGNLAASNALLSQSRVVVCSGSRLALTLLIAALQPGPQIVGAVTTQSEGLEKLAEEQADLLICTDRLEQGNGGSLVAQAKALPQPPTTLMVVTQPRRLMAIHQALQANCDGLCLESNLGFGSFLAAIRSMQTGGLYLDRNLSKSYFEAFAEGPGNPLAQLTPREVDILQLMADGTENQGIGQRLHLSFETVKDHIRHIFQKLNAKSRIQAAVQGIRLGLVEWPDPR
ncbi:DNA-binding response regulator [Synechococcus sp. W4D4]|uniref:response regulator transcription factor n=1 Tax=Synechococcus sp. W4D4 TaxID=3392294 RepID=UPI0039E947E5